MSRDLALTIVRLRLSMGSMSDESGSVLPSCLSESEVSSGRIMDLSVMSESSSSDVPSVAVASELYELSMFDRELDTPADVDDSDSLSLSEGNSSTSS